MAEKMEPTVIPARKRNVKSFSITNYDSVEQILPLPSTAIKAINSAPPPEIETAFRPFKPLPLQIKLVEILYRQDPSRKPSYRAMAKALHVEPQVIYDWFSDTGFLLWLKGVRQVQFAAWRPIVDSLLMKHIYKGRKWAYSLFYELSGDLSKTIEEKSTRFEEYSSMDVHKRFLVFQQKISTLQGTVLDAEPDRPIPQADTESPGDGTAASGADSVGTRDDDEEGSIPQPSEQLPEAGN